MLAGMTRKDLLPGTLGVVEWVVKESDLASALSSDHKENFPHVFATARMVALMEVAAARAMEEILAPGELTAGVSIDVTHTAATPQGANVRATARFLRMEGKFYRFEVSADDETGEVGRGIHDRAIIQHDRLLEGAQRRRRRP